MQVSHTFFTQKYGKPEKSDFSQAFYGGPFQTLLFMYRELHGLKLSEEEQAEKELREAIDHGVDYITIIEGLHDGEPVGYLMAGANQVLEIFVLEAFRHCGHAFSMLREYKAAASVTYAQLKMVWSGEVVGMVQLALKCGFSVTSEFDPAALNGSRTTAYTPENIELQKSIIDNWAGYVDFRGSYAVVDGHYTLAQLEAILTVARKELTE
jgi:hypothetical protein